MFSCYRYCLLLIFSVAGACCFAQQRTLTIPEIRAIRSGNPPLVPTDLDKIQQVEGYFFMDPAPILLTTPFWSKVNTPMPDDVYITLDSSKYLNTLRENQGAKVRVRGYINNPSAKGSGLLHSFNGFKETYNIDFRVDKSPEILEPLLNLTAINPGYIQNCPVAPGLCIQTNNDNPNYALLFSGGKRFADAHKRYWNNLKFLYQTLRSKYGYPADHIIVVYKEGKPNDGEMPVDYPATVDGFSNAIHFIASKLNGTQDLLFYSTNHGGGYDETGNVNHSGEPDAVPGDETDRYSMDETLFYYKDEKMYMTDDYLAEKLGSLHYKTLLSIFQQCFGGGFIKDVNHRDNILISASSEFQFSYGLPDLSFDVFSKHFIAALNGFYPDNSPCNADSNGDGRISVLEAFNFAKSRDDPKETCLLEDNKDGIGSHDPGIVVGKDGFVANRFFLK